jgi:hypothetical protein
VEKRDLNRSPRHIELRAILAGPDRQVLAEATIPDDGLPPGKLGPPQRVRLRARIDRKGVCALNVTVSRDPHGEAMLWGFRTNCPRYLIETSRGHRDVRREEPIVLDCPHAAADVCFLPRPGEFGIAVAGLPDGAAPVELYDGRGALIQTFANAQDGRAGTTVPGQTHRAATPWRLRLPAGHATIEIDGVTRWNSHDVYANLPYWTPEPASFFPWLQYRWLLTPYNRTVYGRPGEQGRIAFQVHNNSDREKTFGLTVEFPGDRWPASLSTEQVRLRPKKAQEVHVQYTVPAEGKTAILCLCARPVDDPGFSTYSTLSVKAGTAPAAQLLDMPIVLKPYLHENEQFGYLPRYPVENQLYFDPANRPMTLAAGGLAALRDGTWTTSPLRTADPALDGLTPAPLSSKVAFDRDGDVYVLAGSGRRAALLHSADGGRTFSACPIPNRQDLPAAFDVEQFSGHNVPDSPPPVLRYTRTASDPRLIWRKLCDLELFLPSKKGGRISMGTPVLVSKRCLGLAGHSGMPSSVVSWGDRVHLVWAEATDPGEKTPGTPAYAATYDRTTGKLGRPVLLAYGAPANDVHNSPSITVDSKGYLHVLAGTHGKPFPYTRSSRPNDAHSGWTDPLPVANAEQTYIGLVCGPDDALHAVFRMWRRGQPPFASGICAVLAYQRKPAGKPWEAPRALVVPPFSEYSVYYHRLTIDRAGRLYVSYDYWSTFWFYRSDHWGKRRAVLMSPDGGAKWRFADFACDSG